MTPTCPACKAKFQHNKDLQVCGACGIPDDVVAQGSKRIARWKKQSGYAEAHKVKHAKARNKHGRRGVKK